MESFILQIKDFFNSFIWEQIQLAFKVAGPVINTFKYLAFMLVLARIVRNLYNNPMDWWGYISWLPLSILLFQYETVVEFFVDISTAADDSVSFAQNQKLYLKIFKLPILPEESDLSLFDITVGYLKQMYRNMVELVVMTHIFNFVAMLSIIVYIFLKIKAMLRFITLLFFGPISISLSFLPGNEFQWLDWVMKLLETALFIPMLMFIDFLAIQVLEKAFAPLVVGPALEVDEQIFRMWLGVAFFIMLGVSYFFVPSMVKWGIAKTNSGIGGSKKAAAAAVLAARKALIKA